MEQEVLAELERRLGRLYARQRLGIERDHEAQLFGQGLNFFHIENWYSVHSLIRNALRLVGLYSRGRKNAAQVEVRSNLVRLESLPPRFEGYCILHISDLHADMSGDALRRVVELVAGLQYDICVLTGDYRGKTYGPFEPCVAGVASLRAHLRAPVYAVLGNHDTIRMVPSLEALDIRILLNQSDAITRDGEQIYLAGIDDAHFYRVDNIEKAAEHIPHGGCAILLSHTPEVYRQAAHAGFALLLAGHTHGGQICLPGSIPITLSSALPRSLGSGAWQYHDMAGYTSVGAGSSVVPVRINCPPEITLHRLVRR